MKRKRPKTGQHKAVKLALKSILRPQYRDAFVQQVEDWCLSATAITVLASLFFLQRCNEAYDNEHHEYFLANGFDIIKECFNSVLNSKKHLLPIGFRHLIHIAVPNFEWPDLGGMGNAFNAMVDLYKTNVKNNIRKHSYNRIKKFFTLKRFELNANGHNISDIDVKNATKSIMFQGIVATPNVDRLLQEAPMIGIPMGVRFVDFVHNHWFNTIPIFINIQRQIFDFHERFELLNDQWRAFYRDRIHNPMPRIAQPPKIKNFRVIPLHDFKMKHIRIDVHLFYFMACKLGALKLAKGFFGKAKNISKDEYHRHEFDYWNVIFDMNKITKVGNGKDFDYAIITDSVAVSLIFMKPDRPAIQQSDEEIRRMYNNGEFTFVLGMDPGVRTWNATVRKHIASGVEVCMTQ